MRINYESDEYTPIFIKNRLHNKRMLAAKVFCSLAFLGAMIPFILLIVCELSQTSFEHCLCFKYSDQSSKIQTCQTIVDNTNNFVCGTNQGYWKCTGYTDHCPVDNGGFGGRSNCTFHESTIHSTIPTCNHYVYGEEKCFADSGICCWYPN